MRFGLTWLEALALLLLALGVVAIGLMMTTAGD